MRLVLPAEARLCEACQRHDAVPVGPPGVTDATKGSDDVSHLCWILSKTAAPSAATQALLSEFDGFAPIFAASAAKHFKITRNIHATQQLAAFRAAAIHLIRGKLADRPLLNAWPDVLDYLRADLGHRSVECVRVLFLNTRNRLIKDELMWSGTIDECSFHVRQVIVRALELDAAALILAHNHPSGDPTPSHADIDLTRAIARAAKPLGIAVHDHIIMTARAHSSMRATNLI